MDRALHQLTLNPGSRPRDERLLARSYTSAAAEVSPFAAAAAENFDENIPPPPLDLPSPLTAKTAPTASTSAGSPSALGSPVSAATTAGAGSGQNSHLMTARRIRSRTQRLTMKFHSGADGADGGSAAGAVRHRLSVSALWSMTSEQQDLEVDDDLTRAQKVLKDLKSRISSQSKRNFLLEKDVRYLDGRIALLIQNRMAMDEEMASHLAQHFRRNDCYCSEIK